MNKWIKADMVVDELPISLPRLRVPIYGVRVGIPYLYTIIIYP